MDRGGQLKVQIIVKVNDEERIKVLQAITALNDISHVKHMSQTMISTAAGIKPTKVRAVLVELVNEELIVQYNASDNARIARYYYAVTDAGKELMNGQNIQNTEK